MKNWDEIRLRYIRGHESLREISESCGVSLSTLKKRSAKERWSFLRNQYRTKLEQDVLEKTKERQAAELGEVRLRHLRIAQALQSKAIERLRDLDHLELSPEEARRYLEAGVRIERLVLGEATERFDLGAVARFAERLELMRDEDIILLYQRLLEIG
jgi:ABC-type branched-subunit amino acid transport system ATPase component